MKPQDIFISARDFFAILVPGALLILLLPTARPDWDVLAALKAALGGDNTLVLFGWFVVAYAIGTALTGVASRMDRYVDPRIARRVRESRATPHDGRADRITKLGRAELLAHELELTVLPGIAHFALDQRPWSTRAFWWNYLRLNCPAAIAELDRIEAQQKQFRSMSVGAMLMALASLWTVVERFFAGWIDLWSLGLVALYLLGASLLIYSYMGFRVRFSRRLFELAIVHAVPQDIFRQHSGDFFKAGKRWGGQP